MLLAKMISQRIVYAFVVAAIAGISSIAIAMSLFVPFSSVQQEAMAQQNETTATTTTANQSTMPTASNNKNFTLYNTEVEGLDETYIYTLPVIVANSGDSVTVSLHNVPESDSEGSTEGGAEDSTEGSTEGGETEGGAENATEGRHSFTIDAQPYSVDIDTAGGEIGNATFTADQEGIFQYHCKYHPQTMTGELVVLPPSLPTSSSSQPAT
jgi:FtsP/CotA-like multicopper oxidase with cupredoxin domain